MSYRSNNKFICVISENESNGEPNPIALVPYTEFIQFELLKKRLISQFNINEFENKQEEEDDENEFNVLEFVDKCLEFEPFSKRFCSEFKCAFVDDVQDDSVKLIWIYVNGLDNETSFLNTVRRFWMEDYGINDNLAHCHDRFKDNIVDTVFILENITVVEHSSVQHDVVFSPYRFISMTK